MVNFNLMHSVTRPKPINFKGLFASSLLFLARLAFLAFEITLLGVFVYLIYNLGRVIVQWLIPGA